MSPSNPPAPAAAPAQGGRLPVRFPASVVAAVRASRPAAAATWVISSDDEEEETANGGEDKGRRPAKRAKGDYSQSKGSKDSRNRQAQQKACENEVRAVVDPDILAAVEEEGGMTPAARMLRAAAQTIVALQRELRELRAEEEVEKGEEMEVEEEDGQQEEAEPGVDDPREALKEELKEELMGEMKKEMDEKFAAMMARLGA